MPPARHEQASWDFETWLQGEEKKRLERVLRRFAGMERLGPVECEEFRAIAADVAAWQQEVLQIVRLNTAIDEMFARTVAEQQELRAGLDDAVGLRLGDLFERLNQCGRRLTEMTREEREEMEGILWRLLGYPGEMCRGLAF